MTTNKKGKMREIEDDELPCPLCHAVGGVVFLGDSGNIVRMRCCSATLRWDKVALRIPKSWGPISEKRRQPIEVASYEYDPTNPPRFAPGQLRVVAADGQMIPVKMGDTPDD